MNLTPLQQGMLFHALAAPKSGVDIEQIEMRLHETLDIVAFQHAWQRVLQQHPILRTFFVWEKVAEPMQEVVASAELPLTFRDLRDQPSTSQAEQIAQFRTADRHTDFDFTAPPLMRVAVFQLADDDFWVLWTFHHILLDGRSFPIVLRDLFNTYNDPTTQLSEPRPFSAYLNWRNEQDFSESDPFWRNQLAGFDAPTQIDFGAFGRQPAKTWGEVETHLTNEQTTQLTNFAKQHGVTLHTLIQGAWAILLHHYSRENEVIFASTRACRYWSADAKDMVGLFINTLPIRAKLGENATLVDYLNGIRETQIVIRPHEHTPLPHVQQLSDVSNGTSLFDSLVVFDSATLNERMAMPNRTFRYRGQTNFPLSVLGYGGERLLLRLEHESGRYPTPVAERMLAQLATLLVNLPNHATQSPLTIPYLSKADEAWLTQHATRPDVNNADFIPVHEQIATRAAMSPNRIALRFADQAMTYGELDARSNGVAAQLLERVSGNQFVGLAVERSAEMVVAMLGILKAGCAYVPIDPTYPRDRMAHMLNDSAAPVVITNKSIAPRLPLNGQIVLNIEDIKETTDHRPQTTGNPSSVVRRPSSLAYVIYTSGSTGKPKGVQVPHHALSNFVASMRNEPGMLASDRVLALTTISFDIAALELILPLTVGAEITIASDRTVANPHAIADLIRGRDITIAQATPATWRMMIETKWRGKHNLKILSGGEPLSRKLADKLLSCGAELWNMYGPTETTIWSTISKVEPKGAIHIGRPIANTSVHILDGNQNPVPVGSIGELCIGGDGVTAGYLNRPKLTTEKFIAGHIPEPVGLLATRHLPLATFYRTGDLARFNPDGTLTCLGRVDHQVKVRGYRIELGEIESVLAQHQSVAAACVVATAINGDEKQLIAYVVAASETVDPSKLRKHAKTKLPDYMVPAHFMTLDAFPLTNNGKINRLALPLPDGSRRSVDAPLIPPRSTTERQIANIWQKLLFIDQVGIHDSFFELGGDSLLVVRMVSQLREQFDTQLGVHNIFEHRSIASLAQHLTQSTVTVAKTFEARAAKRQKALQRRRQRMGT